MVDWSHMVRRYRDMERHGLKLLIFLNYDYNLAVFAFDASALISTSGLSRFMFRVFHLAIFLSLQFFYNYFQEIIVTSCSWIFFCLIYDLKKIQEKVFRTQTMNYKTSFMYMFLERSKYSNGLWSQDFWLICNHNHNHLRL